MGGQLYLIALLDKKKKIIYDRINAPIERLKKLKLKFLKKI